MFSYRSILKQSLLISWKHKYLWFFGLFASLAVAGGSMEYQFFNQSTGQGLINGTYQSLAGLFALSELCTSVWYGIIDLFSQDIVILINTLTILLLTLTIIFVFVWLAISSQAALVDSVKKIITPKKKSNILSIQAGLTVGSIHFWSVLGLNILIKILIGFSFFIMSLPLLFLALSDNVSFIIAYSILFVIFVPVALSLSLIVKYAITARVLENKSVVASLEQGYTLFRKNWLISLEVALILYIISFVATLTLLILLSLLFLPLLLIGMFFTIYWLVFLMLFFFLIALAIFGSFFTTFQISTWTDLYVNLTNNKGLAKLERIFQKK